MRYCALCGLPCIDNCVSTKDFGNQELFFCDAKCSKLYYKNYGHLSTSSKFMDIIAPKDGTLKSEAKRFLLADTQKFIKEVDDAGFGGVTKLVGGAIAAANSPEAKARRAAKAAEEERKLQERLARIREEKRQSYINFSADGEYKKVKAVVQDALEDFSDFVKENYDASNYAYYLSSIGLIRRVLSSGIEVVKSNAGFFDKGLIKRYEKLFAYYCVSIEVSNIEAKIGGAVSDIQAQQKALRDNLSSAKKILPKYICTSFLHNIGLTIKSVLPFFKITKDDVENAKKERAENIVTYKNDIVNAKQAIKDNMDNLKKEEARIKKEGKKELAGANKILKKFKMGFASKSDIAHGLNYAKENDIA